jgi:hypothetical protein
MPFTYLSHQAPVLPLKMVAPRWFDGTALVIGSMLPDLAYITQGSRWYVDAHDAVAQLWFCLPLTLVITWAVKRVIAGPLGAHLPDLGRFHLRDYGRLGGWRMPRTVTGVLVLITSALIGTYSHIAMDSFTHGWGWVAQHIDVLRTEITIPRRFSSRTVPVYDFLQIAGTIVGALITIWCLAFIGKRRMVTEWYPDAPPLRPTSASRRRLVGWIVAGLVAGLLVTAATLDLGGDQSYINRVGDITFVGLLIGCAMAGRKMTSVADRSTNDLVPGSREGYIDPAHLDHMPDEGLQATDERPGERTEGALRDE